jgi:hypothetical protein
MTHAFARPLVRWMAKRVWIGPSLAANWKCRCTTPSDRTGGESMKRRRIWSVVVSTAVGESAPG